MNPCVELYNLAANNIKYGDKTGVCRITGLNSVGVTFTKWVSERFNNYADLYDGDIISNEALFCFDESSTLIQEMTGRDKPQRFRTYSHIITTDGEWHVLTKADKQKIIELILSNKIKILCLTSTGQKHLLFKNNPNLWQLDNVFVKPDVPKFEKLHRYMMALVGLGFSQNEIITGVYKPNNVIQAGFEAWNEIENKIKSQRSDPFFEFTAFLMYSLKKE